MNPVLIERVEGGVIFLLALWVFAAMSGNWWLFALLILAPDISMLGYAINARWGAHIYNAGHTYIVPLGIAILGYLLNEIYLMIIPVIWIAHIGVDRMLGYGLKLPSGFRDTHLGRIGSAR